MGNVRMWVWVKCPGAPVKITGLEVVSGNYAVQLYAMGLDFSKIGGEEKKKKKKKKTMERGRREEADA